MSPDWLIPRWPAPGHVRAVCTTRQGGVSRPPYDGFNLGDHVGDDPIAVAHNRSLLQQALQARPVFLRQVHGTEIVRLDAQAADTSQADACCSDRRGVACTILVADCLPLLVTDVEGRFVAAAHAGWRGLAGGVVEALLGRLTADYGVPASAMLAWLGPCIGPQAFEVGDEVRAEFVAHDDRARSCLRPTGVAGKWLADLPALARQRLQALGLTEVYGNDGAAAWCTVGNPSRFFSHRRDRVSGRMAACIWRR